MSKPYVQVTFRIEPDLLDFYRSCAEAEDMSMAQIFRRYVRTLREATKDAQAAAAQHEKEIAEEREYARKHALFTADPGALAMGKGPPIIYEEHHLELNPRYFGIRREMAKWRAFYTDDDGNEHHSGTDDNPDNAAFSYDAMARQFEREHAIVNFPNLSTGERQASFWYPPWGTFEEPQKYTPPTPEYVALLVRARRGERLGLTDDEYARRYGRR